MTLNFDASAPSPPKLECLESRVHVLDVEHSSRVLFDAAEIRESGSFVISFNAGVYFFGSILLTVDTEASPRTHKVVSTRGDVSQDSVASSAFLCIENDVVLIKSTLDSTVEAHCFIYKFL